MKKLKSGIIIIFSLMCLLTFAHGDEDHSKKKKQTIEHVEKESGSHSHMGNTINGDISLDDFPTLHPLVVHFPIVLILLAALSQLLSFFVFKEQLSWVTLSITILGVIGAFIAGEYVHPHTTELTKQANWVLEEHEAYADYTLWVGFVALILKVASHFFLKRNIWIEAAVAICLIGAGYFVSKAGHYGAQLTHIEKVEIETEVHNHQH
jgi:uncharacterized membrane protein